MLHTFRELLVRVSHFRREISDTNMTSNPWYDPIGWYSEDVQTSQPKTMNLTIGPGSRPILMIRVQPLDFQGQNVIIMVNQNFSSIRPRRNPDCES